MRRRELIVGLGAVTAAARISRAQPGPMPLIGFLSGSRAPIGAAFQQGLSENGFVEGRNIAIDYRLAQGQYDRLPAMAADLVGRKVAVIAASGAAAAAAAKRATSTIPIVFLSPDPIAEGLVTSLARPGGNLTGVSLIDAQLMSKRLDLLSDLVPRAAAFALLVNPGAAAAADVERQTRAAAQAKGLRLEVLKAAALEEIDAAFRSLGRLHAGGLIVDVDPFFNIEASYIVPLASTYAVPTIYGIGLDAWAGGLISYGPSQEAASRQLGMYAARILKGDKPADLPVQEPARFELLVNLKTAKALGLAVPQLLLAQADEVIE